MNRLERNHVRMIQWMCKVTTNDLKFAAERRYRLQLNIIRVCLKNSTLLLSGHIGKTEQSSQSGKCRKNNVGGSLASGRPMTKCSKVIRKDLYEWHVRKWLT